MKAITLFDDTISTLERLKGYDKAIATSSGKRYLAKTIKRLNIEEHFDTVVSANDIRHSKPAPDIFLKAAVKLGSPPEDCIVVEDSLNGIIAAKRANMKTIALLSSTPRKLFVKEARPHVFIKSLSEIDDALIAKLTR